MSDAVLADWAIHVYMVEKPKPQLCCMTERYTIKRKLLSFPKFSNLLLINEHALIHGRTHPPTASPLLIKRPRPHIPNLRLIKLGLEMVLHGHHSHHHIPLLILPILPLHDLLRLLSHHQRVTLLTPLRQNLIQLLIHRIVVAFGFASDVHYGLLHREAQEEFAALFGVEQDQLAVVLQVGELWVGLRGLGGGRGLFQDGDVLGLRHGDLPRGYDCVALAGFGAGFGLDYGLFLLLPATKEHAHFIIYSLAVIFEFMEDQQPKIQVIIRKRPLNRKELQRGQKDIAFVKDPHTVAIRQQKLKVDLTKYTDEYLFTFDGVFDQHINNIQLYEHSVKPLIDSAFSGAKVTCFAYGQTGSGKTYTMLGTHSIPGMYLLASHDIFKKLARGQSQRFAIWVSFYEIYCGKLYDLLNDRAILFAREDAKQNVNIVGLQEKRVSTVEMLMQTIEYGGSVRMTAQNSANADSSRSHAVLQVIIKEGSRQYGKISFIDLAGSERGADHADESKQTRMDGAEINKSLLALKECIRALDQNKNHTPFRGSKLTMVLKDSFTGYCKSLMIGNISPGSGSCENTLNTLKYADRVKQLKRIRQGERVDDILGLMLPRQNRGQRLVMEEEPDEVVVSKGAIGGVVGHSQQQQQQRGNGYSELFPKEGSAQEEMRQLTQRHEELISKIISSEEELMEQHQAHISETVQIVKSEGQLLAEVDRVNSDVHSYLNNFHTLLNKKASSILSLQKKIAFLKMNIKQSKQIERIFNEQRPQPQQPSDSLLLDDLPQQYPPPHPYQLF